MQGFSPVRRRTPAVTAEFPPMFAEVTEFQSRRAPNSRCDVIGLGPVATVTAAAIVLLLVVAAVSTAEHRSSIPATVVVRSTIGRNSDDRAITSVAGGHSRTVKPFDFLQRNA